VFSRTPHSYPNTTLFRSNLELDLQKMQENFGKDYILILRLHYLVSDNLDLTGFENFVYDVSSYEDINELYLMSDMLITDYSSVRSEEHTSELQSRLDIVC